jgi:HD-like signal output (HDOD) protein
VLQGLAILGLHRVSGLALTVALRSYLSNVTTFPALRRCWRHSLACALVSEEISRHTGMDPGEAYTAGLMHDIGRLALVAKHPQDYVAMLDRASRDGLDVLTCERERFGIDHAEAGRWLTAEWGLPKVFQSVTAFHHAEPSGGPLDMVRVVHVACGFADLTGFSVIEWNAARDGADAASAFDRVLACLPDRERERMTHDVKDLQLRVGVRVNVLDPGH